MLRRRLRRLLRIVAVQTFSSLTRRIVVLNLAGLVALVVGIIYLNQLREGLIDASVKSLLTQGEIMASAVAGSATVEQGSINIDPEKLLEQRAATDDDSDDSTLLDFPLNPEKVAPLMKRLVSPTTLRARVYDKDLNPVIDSDNLFLYSDIIRSDLPKPKEEPGLGEKIWNVVKRLVFRSDAPLYKELGSQNGKGYSEVRAALDGTPSYLVSVDERNESIVAVAVPIIRFKTVLGVLQLSTRPGDIDAIVTAERVAILRVFAVAAVVMVILSILLASTIAGPIRQLARAAERVRYGVKSRQEIPDFTERSDEIGHLSGALRDMTTALFKRIEAIESFAADVAHELKNPLTSLRSAVETLPLARSETSRDRLLEVIQHDVRRLDRLISDISDASRLDAELLRNSAEPVDVVKVLTALTDVFNSVERDDGVKVRLAIPMGLPATALFATGHDSRLGQVINNLVDNARSFSPRNGEVRINLRRNKNDIEIAVEDDGPGVPEHALERIFERFYTDRPEEQGFGQNSGLGLSISKQIIEAHGGKLWVENRKNGEEMLGARFVVRLPAAAP
ncbi:stimulus-sensing domain-containing protein [Labrys okinawensis]|uniref:stimulus-sensing domain-containing protein n=1 Tax=Labrys okinawensis TaxID=346911 RepID=UPI0039BD80AD